MYKFIPLFSAKRFMHNTKLHQCKLVRQKGMNELILGVYLTPTTPTLPNKWSEASALPPFVFLSSFWLLNVLKVPLLFTFSITEGEVEHISHMNRDAVWNSIMVVHLLSSLSGGQLQLVCAYGISAKLCICESTLCKHTYKHKTL